MLPKRNDAAVLFACGVVVAAVQLYTFAGARAPLADFRAFWCAGSLLSHGFNPYEASPLAGCEYAAPWFRPYGEALVAIPAPLPGYVLATFAALAQLPFLLSAIVWTCASLAALWFCIGELSRLTGRTTTACAAVLMLPSLLLWLPYGEVVPFALAGALLTARGLRLDRPALVVPGLLLLAVEPHLAAGVWAAAAVFYRRGRAAIVAIGILLCALWASLPNAGPLSYFRAILPLHALSQLPDASQFSLTWILHASGFSDGTAMRAGSISYAIFACCAAVLGFILARRTSDPAMLVFVVLLGEVTGGAYMRESQLAAALPLALALSPAAALLLAVPWLQLTHEPVLLPVAAAVSAVMASVLGMRRTVAFACAAGTVAVLLLLVKLPPAFAQHVPFPVASPLASADAGRYIWSHFAATGASAWFRKFPEWLALGLLWIGVFRSAYAVHDSSSKRSPTKTSVRSSAPAPSSTTAAAPRT